MNWWNRWRYLIFWTAAGIVYLSAVDDWQVYAKPLEQVKSWYEDIRQDFRQAGNVRAEGTLWRTVSGEEGITVSGAEGEVSSVPEGPFLPGAGGETSPVEEGSSLPGAGGETSPVTEGSSLPGAGGETSPVTEGSSLPGAGGETSPVTEGSSLPGAGGEASPVEEGSSLPGAEGAASSVPEDNPASSAGFPDGGGPAGTSPETSEAAGEAAYHTVEDDYFADAVFIGDSRTVGMYEYGGLEETADFYASTGLTIYKMFDSEIVTVEGQRKKISVEQALSQKSYAKIYLMIGINEMGTGTVESFAAAYKEAVDHLLELQPDAILYIQGIIKVSTERSEQGDYINNEGIEARNEALSQLADNERVFYLDVNPVICDESGGLEPSYTFDGVHLKAQYIDLWKTYLKEHAVIYESN